MSLPPNTAPKPAPAPATTAAASRPAATPAPAAAAAAPADNLNAQQPLAPTDLLAGEVAPMPPALAAVLNEEVLPKTVEGLVAELLNRNGQIDKLVKEGNLAEVWLPAMGTKTVALVLAQHASVLPPQKRAAATSAAHRIVSAAWEIDGYGDLGNKTKIIESYEKLSVAVTELKAAYEGIR